MIRTDEVSVSVRQLFQFTPLQYMLNALAERPEMAKIIVDAEKSPETAMILWGHYLFVGGKATKAAAQFLDAELLSAAVRRALHGLVVFYPATETQPNWQNLIMTLFADHCQAAERSVYSMVPTLTLADGMQPDPLTGCTQTLAESTAMVRPIDAELLRSEVANLDMITQEVLGTATYADMDDFMERGIGFCLVIDNRVCGFCTSEYPSGSSVAIGIEVAESWQQRGHARQMTMAFLDSAERRQLQVFWECWKMNVPSARTALACGFRKISDYPVLVLDFSP